MNMHISYWYIFLFLTWQKSGRQSSVAKSLCAKDNLLGTGVLII